MSMVAFEVFADPSPQGSKTVVPTKAGWRTKESSEKRVKPFRAAVRAQAAEAFDGRPAFTGPVELQVTCIDRRPASHFGTGRNAGTLKPSAPRFKTTAPDLSKIVRAVEDALSGVAFVDDARVSRLIAQKEYAPIGYAHRVRIAVVDLEEEVNDGGSGALAAVAGGDRRRASEVGRPRNGRTRLGGAAPTAGAREDEARGGRALAQQSLVT